MGRYTQAVQQLYVAYFNRPADAGGLAYWEGVIAAQNGSVAAISAAFSQSAEYIAAYAGMSNLEIVNQVYQHLFGRFAEIGGLRYWSDLLDRHLITIDNVVTQVAHGAQGSDQVAYDAKVNAATSFTQALITQGRAADYDGTLAIQLLKGYIDSVVDLSTLAQATTASSILAMIQKMADTHGTAPAKLILTQNIDRIAPAAAVTLSGNDTVIANAATLNPSDSIDAGPGVNTLILVGNEAGSYVVPSGISIKNIGTANVATGGSLVIDAIQWAGLNNLNVTQSGGGTVAAPSACALNLTDLALGNGVVKVNGAGNVVANIAGVGSGSVNIAAAGSVVLTETLANGSVAGNITVSGGQSITVNQKHLETMGSGRNAALTINGSTQSSTVSIDSASDLFQPGASRLNQITINDTAAGTGATGGIKTALINGVTDLIVNGNALERLDIKNGRGAVVIHNAGSGNAASPATSLSLSLVDANITNFSDANILTDLDVRLWSGATLDKITSTSLKHLTLTSDHVVGPDLAGAPNLQKLSMVEMISFSADLSKVPVAMVDAQASGDVNIVINGANTSFVGGGYLHDSTVSIVGPALSQSVTFGGGNNNAVLLKSGTYLPGASLNGTSDTTLKIATATASSISNYAIPNSLAHGFGQLTLLTTGVADKNQTINLNSLGHFDKVYVSSDNTTLQNWSADSRLVLTAPGTSYSVANMVPGGDSTLRIVLSKPDGVLADMNFASKGIYTQDATSIEITDTATGFSSDSLTLLGHSASRIVVGSSNSFALNASENTALQYLSLSTGSNNASFTGGILEHAITVHCENGGVNTVDLRHALNGITYFGGNDQDILTVGAGRNEIHGGGGSDVITILGASEGLDSFTTIMDANRYTLIKGFDTGPAGSVVKQVQLNSGASFQNFVSSAIQQGGNAEKYAALSWFYYGNDTYLVESHHNAGANGDFVAGKDLIIKLAGIQDMQTVAVSGSTILFF